MNRFSDILLPSLLSTATVGSGTLMIMSRFFPRSSCHLLRTWRQWKCSAMREEICVVIINWPTISLKLRTPLRTFAPFFERCWHPLLSLSPCHLPHIEIGELVYVHKKRVATYSYVLASDAINPSHVRWFLSRPIYSIPTNPDENFFLHSFWARKMCSTV